MAEEPGAPTQATEPLGLSEHYHRARRQLMLWSGILFAWELVGINLDEMAKSTGQVGPIVKALKSPQAVPWVFTVMVIYFTGRSLLEWYQCTPDRRARKASRIDLGSAMGIACLAIGLYATQTILALQLANRISSDDWRRFDGIPLTLGVSFATIGMYGAVTVYRILRHQRRRPRRFTVVSASTLLLAPVLIALGQRLLLGGKADWTLIPISYGVGSSILVASFLVRALVLSVKAYSVRLWTSWRSGAS